ncbi:MAG: hypothetical protein ACJAV7_001092 [Flavobacteriales bacterium]|jgi:hypothetical protein
MKLFSLSILLLSFVIGNSQALPIDFETTVTTSDFIDFDGGSATVFENPQSIGINTSAMVAQIIRDGGATWSGSKIILDANLDFTSATTISMKVYTSAPVGTTIKFKLEGTGETERDAYTTVSDEWEVLTWDFTGEPTNFNTLVFMFDFDNVGDGSVMSTFLFDDVLQLDGGEQIDLPVNFESATVNYTITDFDNTLSTLVVDPTDANNMVIRTVKTIESGASAGSTIGTPAGFVTNIPLTLTDSKMTIKVWSPEAGTPIRLKVEDSSDPTHTCETETNTTMSEEWEILEFDFANQAPGTELLSVGLSMGWTYNMASIFFNFGTDGGSAGEQTYYFDDVNFGELVLGVASLGVEDLNVYPNPSNDQWTIYSSRENVIWIEVFDLRGKQLLAYNPSSKFVKVEASNYATGFYTCRISTISGTSSVKLSKN